jgi:hypothetical protein
LRAKPPQQFAKSSTAKTLPNLASHAWLDLQSAAAYLAISEQALSRYVKEQAAPASVRSPMGVAFIAPIWTPGSAPPVSWLLKS